MHCVTCLYAARAKLATELSDEAHQSNCILAQKHDEVEIKIRECKTLKSDNDATNMELDIKNMEIRKLDNCLFGARQARTWLEIMFGVVVR